jgi:hypothetical protein
MRSISLLLMTAALGACSTAPQPGRSVKADAHLQQLLAGKNPGPAQSCLSDFRSNNMVVIDDNTIVFRAGGTVYRNDFLDGSCSNLGSGNYALVTRRTGGVGMCRGDIAEVKDLTNGFTVGSCVIGDFVPYTKPRA